MFCSFPPPHSLLPRPMSSSSTDTLVVSEADPAQPSVEDSDESVFSSPSSSQTLLPTDDENTPLLHRARDRNLPWYRRPSPKL